MTESITPMKNLTKRRSSNSFTPVSPGPSLDYAKMTFSKVGRLGMRTNKGGMWPIHQFKLCTSAVLVFAIDEETSEQTNECVISFTLSPSCSVFGTNLGENTFELVTTSKVLHACASSMGEMEEWIIAIRQAINESILDTSDELFQQALLKIDNDDFYEVRFKVKAPLGVVFERSGEWAIIKASNRQASTGIQVGSVLWAINGKSVVLDSYHDTIEKLKDWQPELRLGFRRVPPKQGFLMKQSKSKQNPEKRIWKKRYFILGEGKLAYKDKMDDEGVKNELPLMGSAVSLVTSEEVGREACFRLMSGVAALVVQCASRKQCMEWAATLYHAIAVANGGSYVLMYERDRLAAAEEDDIMGLEPNFELIEPSDVSAIAGAVGNAVVGGVGSNAAKQLSLAERRFEVFTMLSRAVERKNTAELAAALRAAEEINLADEEVDMAKAVYSTLMRTVARGGLSSALSAVRDGSADVEVLVSAISRAQRSTVDAALLADARMELYQIQFSSGAKINMRDLVQQAVNTTNQPALQVAYAATLKEEVKWLDCQQASALVAVLQRVNAETLLSEAMKAAVVEDFETLSDAIEVAKLRRVDLKRVAEAEALLGRLERQSRDPNYVTRLLQEGITLRSIFKLGIALERCETIRLENELTARSRALLNLLVAEESQKSILIKLADAVRLRNIDALERALMLAEEANIEGEAVTLAEIYLERLLDNEREENARDEAMKAAMAKAAEAAAAALAPFARKDTDEDKSDDFRPEEMADMEPEPIRLRKMARRKMRVYKFDLEDEASEEDLRQVFLRHGPGAKARAKASKDADDLARKPKDRFPSSAQGSRQHNGDDTEDMLQEEFVNAMQFSNIWRVITGEKGNLFKEMQMFKRFDVNNNGVLSEEDFIDGWAKMASEPEGHDLLRKIKVLASAE